MILFWQRRDKLVHGVTQVQQHVVPDDRLARAGQVPHNLGETHRLVQVNRLGRVPLGVLGLLLLCVHPGARFTNFTKFLIKNPENFLLALLWEILSLACLLT
jgi:hypothetical protein